MARVVVSEPAQADPATRTPADVRTATARALATDDERERVTVLIRLHGVQLPTASVLLHLARPNLFPIIDFRALWSLGIDEALTSYGFRFWWAYVTACRSLATDAGVTMRRLDRALWQYSNEHQKRLPGATSARIRHGRAARTNASRRVSEPKADTRSEVATGPVERSLRWTFSAPVTLETLAQGKPFTLSAMDGEGILLSLGETESPAHISWQCLEGVPSFLRAHPGWVLAGGKHVATGEPGTLDDHLKRDLQTHVANYVARVLSECGDRGGDDRSSGATSAASAHVSQRADESRASRWRRFSKGLALTRRGARVRSDRSDSSLKGARAQPDVRPQWSTEASVEGARRSVDRELRS